MRQVKLFLAFTACLVMAVSCFPEKTVPVTGIEVSPSSLNLKVGETNTLTVTVSPDNATDKSFTWTTTDPEMSVMALNGNTVKGIAPGEATLIATTVDGGKTAVCKVVVTEKEAPVVHVAVTGITLSDSYITVYAGDYYTLTATVEPADATDPSLTWTSSDPAKVTALENGEIIAYGEGVVKITATSVDNPEVSATCEVNVQPVPPTVIPVESITITSMINIPMFVGDPPFHVEVTVSPEDATDKSLTWESDDPGTAEVDTDGNVTAVNVGETTIRVRSVSNPEVYAECFVSVTPSWFPVTAIYLDKYSLVLEEGGAPYYLTATIEPEWASNPDLFWASDNEAVATVTDGMVYPVSPGEAVIVVSSVSNPEVFAKCSVTVKKKNSVTGVSVDQKNIALTVGDVSKVTCTVYPADAEDKSVLWYSDDENVVYVDRNTGELVAMGTGVTAVRAVTNDGPYASYGTVTVDQASYQLTVKEGSDTYVYDFINMGFDSHTGWCNQNLKAVYHAGYGSVYSWADHTPDNYPYTWDHYIWGNAEKYKLTGYNWKAELGNVDNQKEMLPADDPAYWHFNGVISGFTPTAAQMQELIDNTTHVPATIDGSSGMLFKSKKAAKAIFIPATGVIFGMYTSMEGMAGAVWSRQLDFDNNDPTRASVMSFWVDTNELGVGVMPRYYGIPIRPVYIDLY